MLKFLIERSILGGLYQNEDRGTTGVKHMIYDRSDIVSLLSIWRQDKSISTVINWIVLGIEDTVELCNFSEKWHKKIKEIVDEWNRSSVRQIIVLDQAPLKQPGVDIDETVNIYGSIPFLSEIREIHAKTGSDINFGNVTALRIDYVGQIGPWRWTGHNKNVRNASVECPPLILEEGESIVEVMTTYDEDDTAGDLVDLEMITSNGRKWKPPVNNNTETTTRRFSQGKLIGCTGQHFEHPLGSDYYRLNFHWSGSDSVTYDMFEFVQP